MPVSIGWRSSELLPAYGVPEEPRSNFSEMTEKELDSIFVIDESNLDSSHFRVLGYDIEVKDTLLVEALQALMEKKRNVDLLSYFLPSGYLNMPFGKS